MEGDQIVSVGGEKVLSLHTQEVCRKILDLALTGAAVIIGVSRRVESSTGSSDVNSGAGGPNPPPPPSRPARTDQLHCCMGGQGASAVGMVALVVRALGHAC
jgi:hypothetical protein